VYWGFDVAYSVADLTPSDEARMLADSVARFVDDRYSHPDWRAIVDDEPGYCQARWQQMADLGWTGLAIAEVDGGYGGRLAELLQVVEGLGRGLATEPLVSTAVIGADLIAQCGGPARAILPRVAEGELRLALAHEEVEGQGGAEGLATVARDQGGRWHLDGRKWLVPDAPHADQLIVSARIQGVEAEDAACALFLVPVAHPGVEITVVRSFDRRRLGQVLMTGVELDQQSLLALPPHGAALIARARARLLAAYAAEGLGLAQRVLELTRTYLSAREQFGSRLSGFQVLQHRLVDLFIAVEELRTVARMAMIACELADQRMLGAARIKLIQLLPMVGRQAIQLHGGMGMSDEYPLGDCMKRLEAIALSCGPIEQVLDHFRAAVSAIDQVAPPTP
jgi:alkylation response protein AidB-like acyl-CoA dehydrogenase